MTTPTPLAETIARVERENARLPVGSCPVSQADLTALLSCARRCEAIDRVLWAEEDDDMLHIQREVSNATTGGTFLEFPVDLAKRLLDAASERDALAKRVKSLLHQIQEEDHFTVCEALKSTADERDRLREENEQAMTTARELLDLRERLATEANVRAFKAETALTAAQDRVRELEAASAQLIKALEEAGVEC